MQKLINRKNKLLFYVITLLFLFSIASYLFLSFKQIGLIFFLLLIVVTMIGLLTGIVTALGVTLLLFFAIGSTFFWMTFTQSLFFTFEVPINYLLVWMGFMVVISLLSGRFHSTVKNIQREHDAFKEQLQTLVAVDPLTGFDNKERLFFELEAEISRSRRYGETFCLLLIKIKHLEEFRKLYGDQEFENVLKHVAKGIYETTRKSDLKFRTETGTFAILLTSTPIDTIDIITKKINDHLRTFQLQNNKFVSLTFQFGSVDFSETTEDPVTLYEEAREQVSPYAT